MPPILIGLLLSTLAGYSPGVYATPPACHAEIPCPLGERSYHARLPDDWDGVEALPVLMHFHGWGRQGTLIVKHRRIAGATRQRGVLLLAPNGADRTWRFRPSQTADVPFADAVIEDAAGRWPIDRERIMVSGYSFGSAMAWRYACERGAGLWALLAVAGTIDQQASCGATPRHVRHVHGVSDTVMDFPMGPGEDVTHPVALWRRLGGCRATPSSVETWQVSDRDVFRRYRWDGCLDGRSVALDVHRRGHFIPVGWIGYQLDGLLGLR